MSFDRNGEWLGGWVYTPRPPEHRAEHESESKLYQFDMGGQFGFKENGHLWYRLNCSYWFGDWIEANGGEGRWRVYGSPHRAIYIVREDLFAFIKLKWL